MSQTLDVCLDYSIGADTVGDQVYIALLPDYQGIATCNGAILATVTYFEKIQGKLSPQKQRAWDVCKKVWVENTTYDYHYDYCYTLEYDDIETSPPGQKIEKTYVADYVVLSPKDEFLAGATLNQESSGTITYRSPICIASTAKLLSTQAGNLLSIAADKGLYINAGTILANSAATLSFSVSADSGPSQTINQGDNLQIVGGNGISTATSATDKVTVSAKLSATAGNIIQFNAGGLYAALPGSGATDRMFVVSVTPSGTSLIRHIAIDGGIGEFYTGFNTVRQNTGCGSANIGVGTNKMVRSISLLNNELRVDAAPEHSFATASSFYSAAITQDISVSGFTYDYGPTPPIVIVNLNLCRQVNVRYFVDVYFQLECYPLGVWRHNGVIDIGAGPVVVPQGRYGTFPGLTGIPAFGHFSGVTTIAPAGSRTITAAQQLVVEANSSGGTSRIVQGSVNIGYVGGTA